jgi:hypothetical protein
MASQKVLNSMKWLLIGFLICCIFAEIYSALFAHYSSISIIIGKITALILLIIILKFQNKFTWVFALIFFLYGMYNIMFTGTNAAVPTPSIMEFTSTLFHFAYEKNVNPIFRIAKAFPLLFYFFAFLAFATPSVRKWYGFANFKPKSQDSYLK